MTERDPHFEPELIGTRTDLPVSRMDKVLFEAKVINKATSEENEAALTALGFEGDALWHGLHGAPVYARYTRADDGAACEVYGNFTGLTYVRRESVYDGGDLVSEHGWGLAVTVESLRSSNYSKNNVHHTHTLPLDDPLLHLELAEERLDNLVESVNEQLVSDKLTAQIGKMATILHSADPTRRIKKIGKIAHRIVNHEDLRGRPDLQYNVGLLIKYGLRPGRYRTASSRLYETRANIEPGQLPIEKPNKRTRHRVDGHLVGAVFIGDDTRWPYLVFKHLPTDDIPHPTNAFIPMHFISSMTKLDDSISHK